MKMWKAQNDTTSNPLKALRQSTCPLCGSEGPEPMMLDATEYACGTIKCLRSGELIQSSTCKERYEQHCHQQITQARAELGATTQIGECSLIACDPRMLQEVLVELEHDATNNTTTKESET